MADATTRLVSEAIDRSDNGDYETQEIIERQTRNLAEKVAG
jgi:hypothetical protein